MKQSTLARLLALVLALVMVIGIIPLSSLAAVTIPSDMTLVSQKETALAPGVTETEITVLDKNGDRVRMFVVNANVASNSDVQVKANYQNNDNTGVWGKATVVEQANAATAKRGYNVVASINASYYNVSTGQPTGGFAMEGININGDSMGNSYPFFAVLKDGTAMIGQKGTFSQYSADIVEAIGGWTMLVWDGEVVATNDTNKYPRSTVGVTAEGDVVLMQADGNQKPFSAGLTLVEQAKVMKELGCVAAVELDGGGSSTYAAKLEGTDEIVVRNSCCDGTVRSVSNTLMVISTAVADGVFDHANLSTEYVYHAPYSQVEVTVYGADKGGYPAEIPANATWTLSDDSFGTIVDGVFTSNGKTGTVTASMMVDGVAVGTLDMNVVHPNEIAFQAEEKMIPYGRPSDFTVDAWYNDAEVYVEPQVFDFVCTAGTMNGFVYTAPAEDAGATATVTVSYKYDTTVPSDTISIEFGKGSDVLFDFEDGIDGWGTYFDLKEAAANGEYTGGFSVNHQGENANTGNLIEYGTHENVFLATKENGGKVHSGDSALGYTMDYRYSIYHGNWLYAYLYFWGEPITLRDTENGVAGTRLGMWMYIPEEAVGSCARFCYVKKDANGNLGIGYLYLTYQYVEKGFSKLTSDKIPEAGWAYVYVDMSQMSDTFVSTSYYKDEAGNLTGAANGNYAPGFIQFIKSSSAVGAEKVTFYIDDITLDYSDAVDDRDMPIISDPLVLDDQNSYAIDGSEISFYEISVTASAVEDTTHGNNYTGLNTNTAQVYVDGQKVPTTFSAGKISASGIKLADGVHDITFEIADKQGNYTKLTRQLVVNAGTDYPCLTLSGAATGVDANGNVYTGGQYNISLTTDKVEAIDNVEFQLWLNSASKWALEHMTVLHGFEASYELDELSCMATIKLKRVASDATGDATLITIPVYAWSWDAELGVFDASYQWNNIGCAPQIDISYKVKYGTVGYTEDYLVSDTKYFAGFSTARVDVDTELNSSIANLKNTIGEWHYHTEVALDDVAATCTEDGYTGRTACSVCNSVLNWGTTLVAPGHDYKVADGQIACDCGEVKKVSGLVSDNGKLYYAINGALQSGWIFDGENYYFFNRGAFDARDGYVNIDGHYYTFEDHKLVRGDLFETEKGLRYYWAGNPVPDGWAEIDGATYYFYGGYAYTGVNWVETSRYSGDIRYYLFGEDGILIRMLDGIYEGIYYQQGKKIPYLGLVEVDGAFYYVNDGAKIVKNMNKYVATTNGLTFADGTPIAKGYYNFDENGKMIVLNGLVDGVYYENSKPVWYKGLIEHEGDFYYVNDYGKVVTNIKRYVSNTNDLTFADGTPIAKGYYEFDENGKMIVLNGVVDGVYYENSKVVWYKGLVEQDGAFYYVNDYGKVVTNTKKYVSNTNDLAFADGTPIAKGYYEFDENGKMIVLNGVVDGVYYENSKVIWYKGLVEQDGDFYYVNDGGKVVTSIRRYVSNTNGLTFADGTPIAKGYYEFDENGKMILN